MRRSGWGLHSTADLFKLFAHTTDKRIVHCSVDLTHQHKSPPLPASAAEPKSRKADADSGISLVEMLVTIVLLAVTGVAVLGAMASAATGSSVNQSQAAAVVWLQSTADYLAGSAYTPCVVGSEAQVGTSYQLQLQDPAAPKSQRGWSQSNINIVQPVLFWDGSNFTGTCFPAFNIQQVTVRVVNPANSFSDTLVIVRSKP